MERYFERGDGDYEKLPVIFGDATATGANGYPSTHPSWYICWTGRQSQLGQ